MDSVGTVTGCSFPIQKRHKSLTQRASVVVVRGCDADATCVRPFVGAQHNVWFVRLEKDVKNILALYMK